MQALLPLIRANPVLVYSRVATDPDLRGLAQEPEIRALIASTPGDVQPDQLELTGAPLVGLNGSVVAVPIREESWGSSGYQLELMIYATGSGRELLRTTLVVWSDNNADGETLPVRRDRVQQRFAQVSSWLRDLGFSADRETVVSALESLPENGKLRSTPLKIKHDPRRSGYTVWRDGRVIAQILRGVATTSTTVAYAPSAGVLTVAWTIEAPEGCDSGPETFAQILRIH